MAKRSISPSRSPKQNKRHRTRTAARHAGRRQTPGLHEHYAMMFGANRYDPDNDGDNDATGQTGSTSAGGTSTP